LTTVCPNTAELIDMIAATKETMSHCQPVAIYAWRVR